MPRPIDSDVLTALKSGSFHPALFVEMHFATGPAYIWSGLGTISFDGHSWTGIGSLMDISAIDEGATVEARGITITLSGIDPGLLADAVQEIQVGLPAIISLGVYDNASPPALLSTPVLSWAGRIDQPTVEVGAETATLSINCENRLIDMNVACDRRYTQDDNQIENPGDDGFKFVASIQERMIFWGRVPSSNNNL